ncbi:hypothetical protein ACFLWU_06470 [Chloroflexota bacterium]
MEKKEIKIGNRITVAGVTLIPVSKVTAKCWQGKRGFTFSGSKQPDSIVVITPTGKKAFNVTGEEIDLDELARQIPEITGITD